MRVVFEDALPGVDAARKAGMQCVAITTTNRTEAFSSFENIVQVIDDFTQLRPDDLLLILARHKTAEHGDRNREIFKPFGKGFGLDFPILKIGHYPLPKKQIEAFFNTSETILVTEEGSFA